MAFALPGRDCYVTKAKWRDHLDDAKIVAKFAETHQKLFMTIDEAIALSREVARRALQTREQFDMVVGIGNGAFLPAKVIASELQIPMETIRIRRKGSKIKDTLSTIPGLAAFISFWYHTPVINIPLKYIMNQFSALAKGSDQFKQEFHEKRILLVDDAIETGQTLVAAKMMLTTAGAKSVKAAVLAWSNMNSSHSEKRIQPDIFIGRRIQHFPWSRNSPYYHDYEKLLQQPNV